RPLRPLGRRLEMRIRLPWLLRALAVAFIGGQLLYPQIARSQSYSEDFTGVTTTNPWYFTGGACLTAGNVAGGGTQPGPVAGCSSVFNSYYTLQKDADSKLGGGDTGKMAGQVWA